MLDAPETLQTARLRLRLPVLEDAEDIFNNYAQDLEVTRYLTWKPHNNIAGVRDVIDGCRDRWNSGMTLSWVIEQSQEPGVIGMISCRPSGHRINLGYVLARKYWGRGYMTEAVGTVVEWALSQPSVHRVWATCDVDNLASKRVFEKVGMEYEGTLRRWDMHPNISAVPRDALAYSRVKSDS